MGPWLDILLPLLLLMGRVTAFFVVLPIFGWRSLPKMVRAGIAVLVTYFFSRIVPAPAALSGVHWLAALLLMIKEIACGLALGLAVRMVYSAVQQGAVVAMQQMGFADAGIINPGTGESARPTAMLFEMTFTLLFLVAGGHHVLLLLIAGSYESFPIAAAPDLSSLAGGIVEAGAAMLLLALRIAAPVMAAFLLLAVVLGVLARVLPEMNILMTSFPLRVAVGMLMAKEILPYLDGFADEVAQWMTTRLAM